MLIRLSSDKPSFKSVTFNPGFNVVIAERTKDATKKDSRNGLGKSTFVEIIHFCLGADAGDTLKKPEMKGWTFNLEIELRGKRYVLSRNTNEPNVVFVEGDTSSWQIKPTNDKKTGRPALSQNQLNKVLGALMFSLADETDEKYSPQFRALISYLIRRNTGFTRPFANHEKQYEWDKQIHNAYLLDLNWQYASQLQVIKDKKKILSEMKKASEDGLLPSFMGKIGELEAQKVRLEEQTTQYRKQLDSFKVHPQYERIESDANKLTRLVHDLVNENVADAEAIEHYEKSLVDENDIGPERVKQLYQEAGVSLWTEAIKRLDDVLEFHASVIQNRKQFLAQEIARLKTQRAERNLEIQRLTTKRAELVEVLQHHGALQEYTRLHTQYQQELSELADVRSQIDNLRKFEKSKSEAKVAEESVFQVANNELIERQQQREQAIRIFNANSKELYEAHGNLSIQFEKTGYKFHVSIERSGSNGIDKMKIFCYDLMLAELWAARSPGNVPLIHDSIIFADVDERQIAMALQLAKKTAERCGFQYICTLNSDKVPTNEFEPGFSLSQYVVLELTDAQEHGSLLGVRF